MMTHDEKYSSSGKMTSYTRELDSYRSELYGDLYMMPGAWEVNTKARVVAYCNNPIVVVGFKQIRRAIGRDAKKVAPTCVNSVDLKVQVEHWC